MVGWCENSAKVKAKARAKPTRSVVLSLSVRVAERPWPSVGRVGPVGRLPFEALVAAQCAHCALALHTGQTVGGDCSR